MTRNGLYLLLTTLLVAGYAYLTLAFLWQTGYSSHQANTCLVKVATGIPCPSCGSTRSVLSILSGHFIQALLFNPLGFIIIAIMLVVPLWLLYDLILSKDSLHRAFRAFEQKVNKWWIAIPLILLVIANWIWNINKGL